jgi:hypothetical protein
MKMLKLLAVLLSYPSEELVAALPEIAQRLGAEPACWRNSDARICSICRSATSRNSIPAARPRCICSSTCTATRAIAVRRWWI